MSERSLLFAFSFLCNGIPLSAFYSTPKLNKATTF
jgi:hypothetical protein